MFGDNVQRAIDSFKSKDALVGDLVEEVSEATGNYGEEYRQRTLRYYGEFTKKCLRQVKESFRISKR